MESKHAEKNRSNTNEKTVLEAVEKEYEGKDCFIFHSFTTGIDGEVVKQVCSEIKNQVANSKSNFRQMAAIERKLRRLAKLACIDWVQVEPSDQNLSDKDFLSSTVDNFKKALNQKSQEKDIVIVSLSQQAIIHIEVKSSKPDSGLKQLTQFEEYLQELQSKDMMGGWALVRFIAIPESRDLKMKTAFCDQCKPHILLKSDMEQLFNDESGKFTKMVDRMIKEDKAEPNHIITVDNFHHQGRSKNTRKDFAQLEKDISQKLDKLKASSSFQNLLTSSEYQDLESDIKKKLRPPGPKHGRPFFDEPDADEPRHRTSHVADNRS